MTTRYKSLHGLKAGPANGLDEGQFTAYASVFGNVDSHGDRVVKGAFSRSLKAWSSGRDRIPVLFGHRTDDPDYNIGAVVKAVEDEHGLKIVGELDLDSPKAAQVYRLLKGRRISDLSFAYSVRDSRPAKSADGGPCTDLLDLDLHEVSVVPVGANSETEVLAVKSGIPTRRLNLATRVLRAKNGDHIMPKTDTRTRAQKDRDGALALAAEIVENAEALQRELTDDEAEKVEKALGDARRADGVIAEQKRGTDLMRRLEGMAPDTGAAPGEVAPRPVAVDRGRFALATAAGRKSAAALAASAMQGVDSWGRKALLPVGETAVSTVVDPEPHAEGRPAVSFLELLPAVSHGTPVYGFLRQNERDFAAAPVKVGDKKPTSKLGLERVEQTLKVLAHLSDPIDKYALADTPSLERFVGSELLFGLNRAVEDAVLHGADGITGILATDGIESVDFADDVATTVRRAITALETAGHEAGAVVLSPAAWEAAELATAEGSGEYRHRTAPVDRAARTLWSVPVVVSTALADGEGVVLDTSSVALDVDQAGATVEWSANSGDDFDRNQLRARCEGRFNASVFQPSGVVKVATTDAGGDGSGES